MEIISTSHTEYSDILIAVKEIRKAIVDSRYQLAKLVNKQAITLYYNIGEYISYRSRKGHWGSNAIKTISTLLRQELPGLRGFSETSIKDMRIFFEEWRPVFENRQSLTADFDSLVSHTGEIILNRQLTTAELTAEQLEMFFNVAFTHHREILRKTVLQENAVCVSAKRLDINTAYGLDLCQNGHTIGYENVNIPLQPRMRLNKVYLRKRGFVV